MPKKIQKILFVSPTVRGGGAERVVSVLTGALAELGYEVDLVLYERHADEYPISSKVNIHQLLNRHPKQPKIFYYIKKFFYFRNLIKKCSPDVLIPFLPYQVEQTYFASRGLHIPLLVTIRCNPEVDPSNKKMRKRRDKIAGRAEGIFLQSQAQRAYFEKHCPGAVDKCFVVLNPVNDSIFDATYITRDSIRHFVTMGRLEKQKNFPMLIRAFAAAREVCPDITLDIYGEGSLHDDLKQLIDDTGVAAFIHLCGRTSHAAETLTQYDSFIMSSDFEGMPNALMEAMGVGLPCISTDCETGPAELIGENERGRLVPVADRDAMTRAILQMATHPEDAMAMGQRAKVYIGEHFHPAHIAQELIRKIEALPSFQNG